MAGHLAKMNEDRCCKKIFLAMPMGNSPRADSPLRWIDCVEKDLKILRVKNWKKFLKVEMSGKDFWRPGSTQGCRAIKEDVLKHNFSTHFNYVKEKKKNREQGWFV
ncbi:hypothetical protein TNCV_4028001 [Trichonephila clavipes]|nr:hypothetical protein TNCV_4028001 [Trichonephila clavipes]